PAARGSETACALEATLTRVAAGRGRRTPRISRSLARPGTELGRPLSVPWRSRLTVCESGRTGAAARRREQEMKRSLVLALGLAALAAPVANAGTAPARVTPVQRIIVQEHRRRHGASQAQKTQLSPLE